MNAYSAAVARGCTVGVEQDRLILNRWLLSAPMQQSNPDGYCSMYTGVGVIVGSHAQTLTNTPEYQSVIFHLLHIHMEHLYARSLDWGCYD